MSKPTTGFSSPVRPPLFQSKPIGPQFKPNPEWRGPQKPTRYKCGEVGHLASTCPIQRIVVVMGEE